MNNIVQGKVDEMCTDPWLVTEENDPSTTLIYCFPEHGNYTLLLIGAGPLEPRFSQAARSVSISETHIAPRSANKWGVVKGVVSGSLTESSKGQELLHLILHQWGILKGIVNVGLTKSITSPSVVPSPVEAIVESHRCLPLNLQVIRFLPRNVQQLDVERLSMVKPALLASV
ncbi:hypothetical protein CK203_042145 [Vitis vinifera]|uniref:Uncharacterized protein n=1 Tax=Vitis vinifera TaxID=29760 RepID=A0A438HPV6_VITVI|nr:hypothetical protein CK203_042145 [Vitis vinifera]